MGFLWQILQILAICVRFSILDIQSLANLSVSSCVLHFLLEEVDGRRGASEAAGSFVCCRDTGRRASKATLAYRGAEKDLLRHDTERCLQSVVPLSRLLCLMGCLRKMPKIKHDMGPVIERRDWEPILWLMDLEVLKLTQDDELKSLTEKIKKMEDKLQEKETTIRVPQSRLCHIFMIPTLFSLQHVDCILKSGYSSLLR